MMTDWLAQIKARLEAATPGKWKWIYPNSTDLKQLEADVNLIQNAPTDIANLLKAIEAKDALIEYIPCTCTTLDTNPSYTAVCFRCAALSWTPEKDVSPKPESIDASSKHVDEGEK